MEEKEFQDAISSMGGSIRQTVASVNLSYDEPQSPASRQATVDMFQRVESGETTYDQEEERLLEGWLEAKAKENSIN